jgi:hypothetical protein
MSDFRNILAFCKVHDLGFSGPAWTFDNKQKGNRNVKARLDRAVASDDWISAFPDAKVTNIVSTRSDHLPVLLDFERAPFQAAQRELPKYELMWERDPELENVIEEAWTGTAPCSNLGDLANKINSTRAHLGEWSTKNFGNIAKQIKKLRRKIGKLWKKPKSDARDLAVGKYSTELDELLQREEMHWRQSSRINCLREGDRNTKYFHRKATWRQSKNRIKRIKGMNGNWTDDPGEIESMATSFFTDLYTKDHETDPGELIDKLQSSISADMNTKLCSEFSDREIGDALFQIGPLKAPGPDGMPGRFFQRNWG